MKDLLGGKGSGLAEMTNAGSAGAARLHDLHRRLHDLLQGKGEDSAGHRSRDRRERQEAGKGRRRDARIDRQPAARLRPLGRQVLDARHDGHDPQSRPERSSGRRVEGADQERPLRVRQLPPLHPDVRQRRARDSEGRVRARIRGDQEVPQRQARYRARRGRAARGRRALQERRPEAYRQAISAEPERPAEDGARRRVPVVDESARAGIPPHLRHPRSHRHRRQRPDDGVRQYRRSIGHRRRLHAQSGDRRARSSTASS